MDEDGAEPGVDGIEYDTNTKSSYAEKHGESCSSLHPLDSQHRCVRRTSWLWVGRTCLRRPQTCLGFHLTRHVSRHGSLPPVVPNGGPRRPQPSRFAPSKPFVVCSLSTKRYAPSKRASTISSSPPTQSSPPTVIAPSPSSAEIIEVNEHLQERQH
ncbi:hypothetical protein EV363DRAFT_766978 [Boletus edulis]|nr:hypothetical protein EV363DRAFT_766978 [Boletus edulis]